LRGGACLRGDRVESLGAGLGEGGGACCVCVEGAIGVPAPLSATAFFSANAVWRLMRTPELSPVVWAVAAVAWAAVRRPPAELSTGGTPADANNDRAR
jgi:hypothetical protein